MGICRQKPYQQLHSVLTKLTPGKVFFSCKSFWALKAASREQNVRNAQPTTQKTWEIAQKFSRGIYKIQITFMTFSYSVSQHRELVYLSIAFEIGPEIFSIPRSRDLPYEQFDRICVSHRNCSTVGYLCHVHGNGSCRRNKEIKSIQEKIRNWRKIWWQTLHVGIPVFFGEWG